MTDKPWNIKDAFFGLLANYIRENEEVPNVKEVTKVNADYNYEEACGDGCCTHLVEYVEIHYVDTEGGMHIHTFDGTLETLLGI